MKTLLAIDTSTDACSVALLHNNRLYSDHQLLPREHTQNILPMVEQLLAAHELAVSDMDGFVVGAGPGSFTGLRIAFGVVQGLAFAVDKPVAAISTLDALALRARELAEFSEGQEIIATIDARMNELYWARYRVRDGKIIRVDDPQVSAAIDISFDSVAGVIGTGLVYQSSMVLADEVICLPDERPKAEDMLALIREDSAGIVWTNAYQVEPLYVRNNVAKKKAQQK